MAKDAGNADPLRRRSILAPLKGMAFALIAATFGVSASLAETLTTHRIPAALALEAAAETVSACAKDSYRETAVVLDADGATIVALTRSPLPNAPRARIRLRRSPSCRT